MGDLYRIPGQVVNLTCCAHSISKQVVNLTCYAHSISNLAFKLKRGGSNLYPRCKVCTCSRYYCFELWNILWNVTLRALLAWLLGWLSLLLHRYKLIGRSGVSILIFFDHYNNSIPLWIFCGVNQAFVQEFPPQGLSIVSLLNTWDFY